MHIVHMGLLNLLSLSKESSYSISYPRTRGEFSFNFTFHSLLSQFNFTFFFILNSTCQFCEMNTACFHRRQMLYLLLNSDPEESSTLYQHYPIWQPQPGLWSRGTEELQSSIQHVICDDYKNVSICGEVGNSVV